MGRNLLAQTKFYFLSLMSNDCTLLTDHSHQRSLGLKAALEYTRDAALVLLLPRLAKILTWYKDGKMMKCDYS